MIYLDSAATTFQKPPEVSAAVARAFSSMSSPGRGGYREAMEAAEIVYQCRCAIGELYGLEDPSRVVFTMNATHALNLAIKTLVAPGGKVVISGYEHNAVTRPLQAINARIVPAGGTLFQPEEVQESFGRSITPGTQAVICNHVSNVFGFIQPVDAIAELCRERRVPLIIDASQSAGTVPLDMSKLGAAFIAMPGHKGLYGPQGTGVLLCGTERVKTLMEGGTGSLSLQQEMPAFLPDRLEAGTHNVPGIAGLLSGVDYVKKRGMENILRHEQRLIKQAAEGLAGIPGITVYASEDFFCQSGVLSFVSSKIDAETLASALAEREIAVRAGLHCAPLAHATANTKKTGTIRVSVSDFNTSSEIYRFVDAVEEILDGFF